MNPRELSEILAKNTDSIEQRANKLASDVSRMREDVAGLQKQVDKLKQGQVQEDQMREQFLNPGRCPCKIFRTLQVSLLFKKLKGNL